MSLTQSDLAGSSAPKPFLKRFTHHYVRWYIWDIFFGVGFHGGQGLVQAAKGSVLDGLVDLVTGVIAYALFGLVTMLVPSLIAATFPKLRIFPTTIKGGILRVVAIAGVLGVVSGFAQPEKVRAAQLSLEGNTACNEANILKQFDEVISLDHDLNASSAPTRTFANRVDAIWKDGVINCDGHTQDVSQAAHAKYLDVMVLGNIDAVVVYMDAKQFAKARDHLDLYLSVSKIMKPIAKAKGWAQMLKLQEQVQPGMDRYNQQLSTAGFPPKT